MEQHHHRPSIRKCFSPKTVCKECAEEIYIEKDWRYYVLEAIILLWIIAVTVVDKYTDCSPYLCAAAMVLVATGTDVFFRSHVLRYSAEGKEQN